MKKMILAAALCALTIPATAMAAPGNDELYQMILENQKQIIDAQTEQTRNESHIKFSKKTGMPEWKSADGKSSFSIGGRLSMDVAGLPEMYKYGKIEKKSDSATKSEMRKLYLSVEGQFADVWEYEVSWDFAGNEVDLKDANITYTGFSDDEITLGWQKTRYGLESTTSSKYLTYMERGLTDALSPDRGIGVMWTHKYGMGVTQLSYLIPNGNEGNDADFRADSHSFLGRATLAPINDKENGHVLHLGVNLGYFDYDDKAEALEFTARPESHLAEKLVGVEFDNPASDFRYALEAAYSIRGFLLTGEYAAVTVEDEDSGKDYSFDACYLSASYMLTGESHRYKKSSGYFKNVMPDNPVSEGGFGALEFSARYSALNLTDDDIYGGDLEDITLGLNWYLESNLKVAVNYVHYEADNYEDSDKYVSSQDGDIFQARLQLFF